MKKQIEYYESLPQIKPRLTIRNLMTIIKDKKIEYENQLLHVRKNQSFSDIQQHYHHQDRTSNQLLEKVNTSTNNQGKIRFYLKKDQERIKPNYRNVNSVRKEITNKSFQNIKSSHELKFTKSIEKEKEKAKANKNIIVALISQIHENPKERNEQLLNQILDMLSEQNIFLNKINRVVSLCLIKMNTIIKKQPNAIIYRKGVQHTAIYLILFGKVKLTNKDTGMKKYCQGGETIGQQLIFNQKIKKHTLQKAKAITESYLLQIKLQSFKTMYNQMMKFGFKNCFNEMEAIIKRNHIVKNWKRTKFIRLHTKN